MGQQGLRYVIPDGVSLIPGERPLLTTSQGGKVAVDSRVASLWTSADGETLEELVRRIRLPGGHPDGTRTVLACLAEAGLLRREGAPLRESLSLPSCGEPVSVAILAFNGRTWLEGCLPTVQSQTHAPIEILVVDNCSSDGTAQWLAEEYPGVRVVRLDQPHSIAAGYNRGIEASSHDLVLLLNQDTRLRPDAVAEMVRAAGSDPRCAAVAPKLMLSWAPAFLNGIGNRVESSSWGRDNAFGHLDLGQFDSWVELPSACMAATMITTRAWREIGPLDEGFRMYYEDVEWCYRARSRGFTVRLAPRAVVEHAFGGRIPTGMEERLAAGKLRNTTYGRLRFVRRVLREARSRFLANYRREDSATLFRGLLTLRWGESLAVLRAWSRFLWEGIRESSGAAAPAMERVLDDSALFRLQQDMPDSLNWNGLPLLTWELAERHYLGLIRAGKVRALPEFQQERTAPRLLIVSSDVVGKHMGGVGARYLEMARVLAEDLDVLLATPTAADLDGESFHVVQYDEIRPESLKVLVDNCDVALVSGYMSVKFPFLHTTVARLVVDLYDPFFLENLYYFTDRPMAEQEHYNRTAIHVANSFMLSGDFFLCGTERQRDFWLGMLAACGRVSPQAFAQDPSLRTLMDVVGVGMPDHEPVVGGVLRGQVPAIESDAKIVLWPGGIWNWLDPLSLIEAWPSVVARHPEARLVFLGVRPPNPAIPAHRVASRAMECAIASGEMGRSIFFLGWLSYADHASALGEAHVGVTLHPDTVEARFSIRTRTLACFWAGLPVVTTAGDELAEVVREQGVGCIVPAGDVAAVAQALDELLDQPKAALAERFKPLRERYRWRRQVLPLRDYCLRGSYAADRWQRQPLLAPPPVEEPTMANRVAWVWRNQGLRGLGRRVLARLARV